MIELLVVVAIISLLAAILFPVFAKARESARRASCLSNLKQIGLGVIQYTQDYDEHLPRLSTCGSDMLETGQPDTTTGGCTGGQKLHLWYHNIYPYVKSIQMYNCPSVDYEYKGGYTGKLAYGYNRTAYDYLGSSGLTISLAQIYRPSESLLIADTLPGSTSYLASYGSIDARHLGTFNMIFFDGHAKNQRPENWKIHASNCKDAAYRGWSAVFCP